MLALQPIPPGAKNFFGWPVTDFACKSIECLRSFPLASPSSFFLGDPCAVFRDFANCNSN